VFVGVLEERVLVRGKNFQQEFNLELLGVTFDGKGASFKPDKVVRSGTG
jgi:hypothetical protein